MLMKHKNDLTTDDDASKQESFGERARHETNDDESEATINEEATMPMSTSTSPTLKKSIMNNNSLSLSSRALSTSFYSQCTLHGISSEDVDNAALETRDWYHEW